jgi:hypothetical protein
MSNAIIVRRGRALAGEVAMSAYSLPHLSCGGLEARHLFQKTLERE